MNSTKIKPRRRGVDPNKLNPQQLLFINTLAADVRFNAVDAARECYPKNSNPTSQASKLLSNPNVQKMLGKVLQKRLDRLELKADDVLEYLRNVLELNPLDYFRPTKDGKWLIKDPDNLPSWVGRLIEKIRVRVIESEDGSKESLLEVEVVSKSAALALAMKHVGVEKIDVKHTLINWDSLHDPTEVIDVVDQRLLEEKGANSKSC